MDLECVDFGWVMIYATVESIDCSSFKNDQQFLEWRWRGMFIFTVLSEKLYQYVVSWKP